MAAAADLQLQNKVSALVAGQRLGAFPNEASMPDKPEPRRSTRRKR